MECSNTSIYNKMAAVDFAPGKIALLYCPNWKLEQRPRPGLVVMFRIAEATHPAVKAVGDMVHPLTLADARFIKPDDTVDDELIDALRAYKLQVEDNLRHRNETHFDAGTGARTRMPTALQTAHAAMCVIVGPLVAQRGKPMPVMPVPVLTADDTTVGVECTDEKAVKYSFGIMMAPTALVRKYGLGTVVAAACKLQPGQAIADALEGQTTA